MLRRPVVKRRGLNGHSFLILPEMTSGSPRFCFPSVPSGSSHGNGSIVWVGPPDTGDWARRAYVQREVTVQMIL